MSHVTTVKTCLTNLEALKDFVESDVMKAVGLLWETNSQIRFWRGQTKDCPVVVKFPGKYDIGLRQQEDGTISLEGDWSYADFYGHMKLNQASGMNGVVNFFKKGQNKHMFLKEAGKKKWKVKSVIDPVTHKERLEAYAKAY